MHAAQDGDKSAFAQLYDRYVDVVFRYVLFRVGDRELAEDVTSETFLRALRRIESVSYQGRDVGAWFVTIARNLVLDHVKSSRFRLEVATAEVDDSRPAESGPEQQVLSKVTTLGAAGVRPPARRRPARMHRPAVPAGTVGGGDREGDGAQRGRGEGAAAPGGAPAGDTAAAGTALGKENRRVGP